MNRLQRALDRFRHPGETALQRDYRRWRDTTGRGEPYRIPATIRTGGPWPTRRPIAMATPPRQMASPIVGVRVEYHTAKKEAE